MRAMRTHLSAALSILSALALCSLASAALAAPDDAHLIENDRVGPFKVGAPEKEALDAALKAFSKDKVNLNEKFIELPNMKLSLSGTGGKAIVESIELRKPTFGNSPYQTKEGVGAGSSEKDIRLAYGNVIRKHKINDKDGLSPESLPAVFFQCAKGKCPVVTIRKLGK
jgi:hypothetical protein